MSLPLPIGPPLDESGPDRDLKVRINRLTVEVNELLMHIAAEY